MELKRVNRSFNTATSIAPKKVYALAADITREIAAVYYPDADNPALMASLSDLLMLDERIVTRLNQKIQEFPLKTVKDISIGKILAGKDYYDSKIKDKLEKLFREIKHFVKVIDRYVAYVFDWGNVGLDEFSRLSKPRHWL